MATRKEPERMMDDVSALAEIPNRGPATEGEARAALYVSRRMTDLGLDPQVAPFRVVPHFPMAWALHALFLAATCLIAVTSPLAALIAQALILISFWGDSTTRFYWIRSLLPSATSRHVIGRLAAKGEAKKTVVFAAHIDSGQMGMIMEPVQAERVCRFHKRVLGTQPLMLSLVVAAFLTAPAAVICYRVMGPGGASAYVLLAAIVANLIPVVIFSQLEFAKISPGANDNGSGVAVMLEMARRMRAKPAENTEVVFVGVGSEETYMMGMACFMEEHGHRFDRNHTYFLVPESCGNGTPRVIVAEGVVSMHHHDPELAGLVFLAARRRGIKADPITLRTGGTDCTPPSVRGYAATGIICMNENDYVPNYHWNTDLPRDVKPDVMAQVADIFEETVRIIDKDL